MDPKDIRTLQLLEEIEKNEMPSQRHLAKQLNISLGLVNSFIKRLVHKGYLKITTIPKNRIRYLLTPTGAAEKTRLTYKYIKYSYAFYKDARKKLRILFKTFEDRGVQRIVFFGATDLTEIAYLSLQETSIVLVAVIDDKKKGKMLFDHPVISMDKIQDLIYDIILITDIGEKEHFFEGVRNRGIAEDVIAMIE